MRSVVYCCSWHIVVSQINKRSQPNLLFSLSAVLSFKRGRSGGAIVLGKLPVPERPTIWMKVE